MVRYTFIVVDFHLLLLAGVTGASLFVARLGISSALQSNRQLSRVEETGCSRPVPVHYMTVLGPKPVLRAKANSQNSARPSVIQRPYIRAAMC